MGVGGREEECEQENKTKMNWPLKGTVLPEYSQTLGIASVSEGFSLFF